MTTFRKIISLVIFRQSLFSNAMATFQKYVWQPFATYLIYRVISTEVLNRFPNTIVNQDVLEVWSKSFD